MTHDACQLYIKQRLEEEKASGKTDGKAAKIVQADIKKLFEIVIPVATLKKTGQRMESGTNVPKEKKIIRPGKALQTDSPKLSHISAIVIYGTEKAGDEPEVPWLEMLIKKAIKGGIQVKLKVESPAPVTVEED